jgi:hypothetical protein
MTTVLAITTLFDKVQQRFADELAANDGHPRVDMTFGWRAPGQVGVVSGTRVVWIPGDESGTLGALLAPKYPGGNPYAGKPRPIANLDELVTLEITGSDATNPENERAQYEATRLLYDRVVRAVYLAAHGTFRFVSSKWITTRKERRFGAAIRLVLAVQAVIPDELIDITTAPTPASAAVNVTELDQSETDQVVAATE